MAKSPTIVSGIDEEGAIRSACVKLSKEMEELPGRLSLECVLSGKRATGAPKRRIPSGEPSPTCFYITSAHLSTSQLVVPIDIYLKNNKVRLRVLPWNKGSVDVPFPIDQSTMDLIHVDTVVDVALKDLLGASPMAAGYFEQVFGVEDINKALRGVRKFLINYHLNHSRSELQKMVDEYPLLGMF